MKNKETPYLWVRNKIKLLSMSTQMILTVVLIFAVFFLLQLVLNYYFFQNYYADKEFNNIENELWTYVESLNEDDADYFDIMYNFTTTTDAMSIITTKEFNVYGSLFSDYTIEVTDTSTDTSYTIRIPESNYNYEVGELLHIEGIPFSISSVTPISITAQGSLYVYNSEIDCSNDCIVISEARVDVVNKPKNLNYEFETHPLFLEELNLLRNNTRQLSDFVYEFNGNEGYHYSATINNQDVLVFINELGTFDLIITIVPIEDTQEIINIVSSYNNFIYVLAILIVFAWSFRLSKVLTKPVQNIESVARQIANLNFDVDVHEDNNRENTSLSRSINLISRNLKETLDTLNTQNDELKELYNEQIKQVSLKKQLVSSISHELKTPLMIMQVTIQGILDGIITEEDFDDELNNVLDEINKSSLMISDMLQIYRLEDANTPLEICDFSLADEVMKLINTFEHNIKKHNLKMDLNMDTHAVVEADIKLIRRVISNFFTNAIKYTPEGERIYIEITQKDYETYFELTNYGVTINEEDLENIWIPFFRTSDYQNNRLPTKGSGIGLYLVSEVLKAHNAEYGIVNVENGVKAFFILKKQTFK